MGNVANWLNTAFVGLDGGVFKAMNVLANSFGGFLTPFCKVITFVGEKGLIFFAAALALMLFSKTRKFGVCMFGAVACGALITNIIVKDSVMRARPFTDAEYAEFWNFIGSPAEDGYSFPSGHVTAITAAALVLFLFCNKKWSWTGFAGVLFMGFSRVYLIAHYFTDVLAGIIVGLLSGVIAFFIAKLIFFLFEKYRGNKFCDFCLNFDIRKVFNKKQKVHEEETKEQEQNKD